MIIVKEFIKKFLLNLFLKAEGNVIWHKESWLYTLNITVFKGLNIINYLQYKREGM